MSNTRNFNRYNFVTGAVDGTLAYDFSAPAYFPEEVYETPGKTEVRTDARVRTGIRTARRRHGFSPLAMLGSALVVLLLVLSLMAHIRLVSISQHAVEMETQIAALEAERDKLTVEYEAVFNLKDVEDYAVNVLGMQEPREEQIHYLSNVSSADKAVVLTEKSTNVLYLAMEDLIDSLMAYFNNL